MLRADLHVHTSYSRDSAMAPERLVEQCLEKDINCVAVTEHDNIDGALAVQRLAPFKVIIAEEVKTSQGELIGLFLSEPLSPGLSPEDTVRLIKEQGGLVCLPHPFDRLRREPLRRAARERILSDIDVVEVFNSRTTFASDNERARRLAEEADLPMSAGSDAHSPGEVGNAYVEIPDFETSQQFLEALRQGKIAGRRSVPWVHLVSTWARLRRRIERQGRA